MFNYQMDFLQPTYFDMSYARQPTYHHAQPLFSLPKLDVSALGDFIVEREEVLLQASDALVEITMGFLQGFVARNKLTTVTACLDDIEGIIQSVEDIIDEFKSLNPSKIVDGIRKLIKIIQDGLGDVDTCKAMNTDLIKVEDWAKNVVTHPDDIVNHVLANISDLIGMISKAIADSGSQEYRTVGDDMAAVVADIFGTVDDEFTALTINWDLVY